MHQRRGERPEENPSV